ncbi:MAG: hypothetical protein IPM27_12020 [Nitrosomonadales bacterium]|nr:hypothetical protein [Nitrosomonadales bacterium]
MNNERIPRWSKWRLMPEVKKWEAVALSLNIEPGEVKTDHNAWMGAAHPFDEGEEFNDRLEILKKHSSNRTHFPTPCILNMANWYNCEVRLDEFAAWCAHVGFAIPPELSALAKAAPQPAPKVEAAPAVKVEAVPVITPSVEEWEVQARAIADECFDTDTKGGCRDSLARKKGNKIVGGYSFRVMELMQERGIKGARGIIDNPATIMREALQGEKWWANKSK